MNTLLEPRQLHNITHPFIESIYIKKEFGSDPWEHGKDVLIIEARRNDPDAPKQDQPLAALLADLDLIRDEVEKKVGKFIRVDIRCH